MFLIPITFINFPLLLYVVSIISLDNILNVMFIAFTSTLCFNIIVKLSCILIYQFIFITVTSVKVSSVMDYNESVVEYYNINNRCSR